MTTLNRDQIAALRDPNAPSDLTIALDMATRLLDLCEAEPRRMPGVGTLPWEVVGKAVNEAIYDDPDRPYAFAPDLYPGHQMLPPLNFNSLSRIIDKFRPESES